MKKTSNSPLSQDFLAGSPSSSHHATTEALRQCFKQSNPIRFAKDNGHSLNGPKGALGSTGYELQPCNPTATEAEKIDIQKIARLKGSRVAGSCVDSKQRRMRVDVIDPATGDTEQRIFRLTTVTITVVAYGVMFRFIKTNRGQSVLDSRTGKRVSQSFVKSELRRILGATEGDAKFAELLGV